MRTREYSSFIVSFFLLIFQCVSKSSQKFSDSLHEPSKSFSLLPFREFLLRTDYAYVLSQSIRAKDTERGFIYPIDKSLLCKMQSRTVRCAKLT